MIFITQGNYTPHATAGMLERPEDRSVETKRLMAAAGITILEYLLTFGEYDFILIGEAKDENTWMAAILVGAAGGGLANLKTTIAVAPAQAEQNFIAAKSLRSSFRSAGDD